MKVLLTVVAYLGTLVAVAVLAFFGVLILAGPHGGLLPSEAGPVVLVVAWATVIIVPALISRLVWRLLAERLGRRTP